jgi:hypothetical protein
MRPFIDFFFQTAARLVVCPKQMVLATGNHFSTIALTRKPIERFNLVAKVHNRKPIKFFSCGYFSHFCLSAFPFFPTPIFLKLRLMNFRAFFAFFGGLGIGWHRVLKREAITFKSGSGSDYQDE